MHSCIAIAMPTHYQCSYCNNTVIICLNSQLFKCLSLYRVGGMVNILMIERCILGLS